MFFLNISADGTDYNQDNEYDMCPIVPTTLGENMEHTFITWTPDQEFEPRTMLSPQKYARWLPKYAKSVVLAVGTRRYDGEQRFGRWGFPSLGENAVPNPYPTGNLDLKNSHQQI